MRRATRLSLSGEGQKTTSLHTTSYAGGQTTAATLESQKYFITSIQICEDVQTTGSGAGRGGGRHDDGSNGLPRRQRTNRNGGFGVAFDVCVGETKSVTFTMTGTETLAPVTGGAALGAVGAGPSSDSGTP